MRLKVTLLYNYLPQIYSLFGIVLHLDDVNYTSIWCFIYEEVSWGVWSLNEKENSNMESKETKKGLTSQTIAKQAENGQLDWHNPLLWASGTILALCLEI